ncbi:MAG: PEP-CTERM sorting domain-containing protein, partial [Deltaproteobacteria bacterium]|nr:PEP-CTERM sorting domain-containing protein [Deltaproteobacteria bacterium]
NQTKDGGFVTLSRTGFVHGAASSNSSTATGSGLIQLIAPQQVTVQGVNSNSSELTLFASLTLHFVPEPGLLLLIGSGVVGLGLLGRSRMKK